MRLNGVGARTFWTVYVLEPGRWAPSTWTVFPFVTWSFEFPIAPGVTPIAGARQRAIAFPYLGAWLDRYVVGLKDPEGWTDGRKADAQVTSGVLARAFFSASARTP